MAPGDEEQSWIAQAPGSGVALFIIMKTTYRGRHTELRVVTVMAPLVATLLTIGLAAVF